MAEDSDFGPHLDELFDFTILFEQSILSLLPATIFILLTPLRCFPLFQRPCLSKSGTLLRSKCVAIAVFACLQIALVVLWASKSPPAARTRTSIAEPAVAIVEACAIGVLSYLEHMRSLKPSALLNSYLILTIILDISLARTFWIRPGLTPIAAVFTASLVCKTVLLLLEETPKTPYTKNRPQCRETSSGVISRSVFWWLNQLFFLGAKGLFTVDDLDKLHPKLESEKVHHTLESSWNQHSQVTSTSLLTCTFSAFFWQFLSGVFPRLLHSGFNYAQPFLIQSVILYVGSARDAWSTQVASGLIGATVLIYIGRAVSMAWYKHMSYQLVTMYRGALVGMIYKKTLKLKSRYSLESAPMTLMSSDIDVVIGAGETLHETWASLLELPVGIYLLYRQVGLPSLFILIPTVVTTVLSGIIFPRMGPATIAWMTSIQERVSTTSNMLDQTKGIKMMGLAEYFRILIRGLRVEEIRKSEKMRWLLAQIITLATVSYVSAPLIVILGAIYWTKAEDGLTIAEAFTSLSIISLAAQPLMTLITSLSQIGGVFGACQRIQAFLTLEEQEDSRETPEIISGDKSPQREGCDLELRVMSEDAEVRPSASKPAIEIRAATFKSDDGTELLRDIDLTIKQGTLSIIVSRVGGGKSSLLKAVIGELEPDSGIIFAAERSAAYCAQRPWLQNISIRANIIGQSAIDETWFWTVVQACALDHDISVFPGRENTLVGSGGVALSGGQKQRIALARAVYSLKSFMVLDDIFSGLDTKTSRAVFQRLLGVNGLLRHSNTTVILSTSNPRFLSFADYITILEEGRIIRNQVSYDSLDPSAWGLMAEVSAPEKKQQHEEKEVFDKQKTQLSTIVEPIITEEDMTRQTGDRDCYRIYLKALGWRTSLITLLAMISQAVIEVFPNIWLKLWTERGNGSRDGGYAAGYTAFALATVVIATLSLCYFIIAGMPQPSNRLHDMLLGSVCRAPLSFFTKTDSGTILNRFSQDMALIDMALPIAFYMTVLLSLRALARTAVVVSGASYVAVCIPAVILALYVIQKYYLKTSRQMRFLDIEMKAPLYTQFMETLDGVSTVRAFGWSTEFMDENTRRLNTSQRAFYSMVCIQRWIQVVLDLLVAGLALVLVSVALQVVGASSQGSIGLALVNLLDFSQMLTMVLDQWTQLETSLGAIARLKWFVKNTPDENKEAERDLPPADWPSHGAIEFEGVSASYNEGAGKVVLENISLKIQPGQKVGVCGRSGSGKSSLALALLRMLELNAGTIKIDGLDLSTIPRQYIRSHLTIVPQDRVNIAGTARGNLDPEGHVQSDQVLVDALEKVSIWSVIETRGGLDAKGSELGLSAGQQQLFCIARAILSRHKVIILDEATSSVDRATNEVLRRSVREHLENKTVVEVAHHLDIIKDFDVVIVMGEGRILEVGDPKELLSKESELSSLWASQTL